ncbi:MAG: cytochrome P450 [Oscillochloris sp.]|nr:cytochrome P450 [Oscillochloris sp.]
MDFSVAPVFMPGPRPDPILGWRGALLPFAADPLGFLCDLYQRYGPLAAVTRHPPAMLFAFGPKYNRRILSDAVTFENNPSLALPMREDSALARIGNGLLAMNGETHRRQRRMMMPSFHRRHVAGYRDTMVAMIDRALDRWQTENPLDIAREMQQITLAVALQTLFSLDAGPEAQALGNLFEQSLAINFSPLDTFVPIDVPGTAYHRLARLAEQIETRVRALIDQRRALGESHQDVLATLIAVRDEDGQALSDDELIGQTYTLFAAGHETSSNALTWALLLLEQHPQVLADLHDELQTELHGDAPSLEQLARLPLLDRVVQEVLRLMPPASVLVRRTATATRLGCYELPADTTIFLSPFVTHRIPELYAAPQTFNPARWEQIDPSPYEYLPFGAGPRMCIGTTFALMEIKLVLARIIQRFRLEFPAGTRIDPELPLTLRPRGGMRMQVRPQDRAFRAGRVQGGIRRVLDLPPAE